MITFSIVIPAYKAEKYIARCLDSVIKQDYPSDDFEIIVVDDYSPDNQLQIINQYNSHYENIIVLKHKKNLRQGGARNTAIRDAQGEYIIFLDSDDYWIRTDVLSIFKKLIIEYPQISIYESSIYLDQSNFHSINNKDFSNLRPKILTNIEYYENKSHPCIVTSCFRKKYILNKPFRENVLYEDTDWKIKIFSNASHILQFYFPFYFYFHNCESSTNVHSLQMYIDHLNACIRCKKEIRNSLLPEYLKYQLSKRTDTIFHFILLIRKYDIKEAIYLLKVLRKSELFKLNDKSKKFSFFLSKIAVNTPMFTSFLIVGLTKIKRLYFNIFK